MPRAEIDVGIDFCRAITVGGDISERIRTADNSVEGCRSTFSGIDS
ncbi:hypothetical protein V144x_31390 [Gimesia aquarii]|uniref:Uncharacterized protein n=1 Tax=Gimesia aquarii TaxID=2527964 RepID=A0A517VXD3_9PLAN|nr:hypothetical protein V144x_31390 [Gimesia aquarii]